MRTNRVKFVLKVAAGIKERNGNNGGTKKESGEDYAKKILEFLEATPEARQRKRQDKERGKKKMR